MEMWTQHSISTDRTTTMAMVMALWRIATQVVRMPVASLAKLCDAHRHSDPSAALLCDAVEMHLQIIVVRRRWVRTLNGEGVQNGSDFAVVRNKTSSMST